MPAAEDQTFAERMTDRNGIRTVTVDGTTVVADSIADEIALDKYRRGVASQTAGVSQSAFGIRFRTMTPPGGGGTG